MSETVGYILLIRRGEGMSAQSQARMSVGRWTTFSPLISREDEIQEVLADWKRLRPQDEFAVGRVVIGEKPSVDVFMAELHKVVCGDPHMGPCHSAFSRPSVRRAVELLISEAGSR